MGYVVRIGGLNFSCATPSAALALARDWGRLQKLTRSRSPKLTGGAASCERRRDMSDPTQLDRIEAAVNAMRATLTALDAKVTDTRQLVRETLSQELQMANVLDPIAAQVTDLTNQVANETTVNQSAITLLNGLSSQIASLGAQLAAAIANQADPAQVSAIASQLQGLSSTITANATSLAAAVTANTPAAPAAPPATA